MKLFKSLLVAPAALGLLAPMSATANEIEEITINDFNPAVEQTLLAGGEGLVDNHSHDGDFSETTVASFEAGFLIGGTEGDADTQLDSEAVTVSYSFNMGLNTTFTGEDDLFVGLETGNTVAGNALTGMLDYGAANADALKVADLHYTRPFGEKVTVSLGDSMDLSKQFAGACVYEGFTDVISDCGTGNSAGAEGDVSLSAAYDIGNGFTFGVGLSGSEGSTTNGLFTKESADLYGMQLAYGADNYGAAVSYSNSDTTTTDTVYWGLNGYYSFDNAFLDSISVGYETANPTAGSNSTAYFVGITTGEVGPGAFSVGMGTNDDVNGTPLITDGSDETYLYEVSYGWNINDSTTATIGGFIQERTTANGDDLTGIALSTSFAF